ncbi:MAG TPA: PEP/pyruvate-binding domain-containing protein, partial [Myxococcota bacterium]
EFFKNAQKEGGVYVDDTGGEFKMMTLLKAREEGLVGPTQTDLDKLRPGVNRKITFLKPTADGEAFEVAARHDAIINAQRKTREVELYIPQDEVKGIGHGVPTFEQLATLGVRARHLAGEKGTVLALLSQHPVLGKYVPKGSEITPGDIRDVLSGAKLPLHGESGRSLQDAWDDVWNKDPKVGVVDDSNFLQSEFYTNPRYRSRTRQALQDLTRTELTRSLIDKTASPPALTQAGAALYANVMKNPALSEAETGSIIFRSSFTGEDRPGKSGAGQYESYVDRKIAEQMLGKDAVDEQFNKLGAALETNDPAVIAKARAAHNAFMGPARVAAAIGVVESTWMPEPIENNAAEQFFLKHIGPTVVVQACMTPDISGVMISRNTDNGARGQVTFQLVKGFGGGVDGGKATEGVIKQGGADVGFIDGTPVDGADQNVTVGGIEVSSADMQKLREIVLETEKFFQETVEPGKGYAVDMEVARQHGEWRIVQARVLLMDK